VTILGCRMLRILDTRTCLEELEELEELDELDAEFEAEFEEELELVWLDCCCLRAFWTEVVMLGVRVEMICWTMEETWDAEICWLLLLWLDRLLDC